MKYKFAVQLYSLRKELMKDFPGVLRELKKQGWEAVQIDGLRGYSAEEIASVLKETGLKAVSMHANLDRLNNDLDNLIYEGLLFGTKDIFCSSELTNEDEVIFARNTLLNTAKKLNPLGFNLFLYPEIDTYWAKAGGADPFEYMKKFSGRIPMIHFKDMKSDLSLSYPESLAEIGTGCIDFLPFLKWGEKNGIEYYIVEQDVSFLSGGMLESMAVSLENLIKLSNQL